MTRIAAALTCVVAAGVASAHLDAQSRALVAPEAAAIYQRLLPLISRIKIFDHHAHPGFSGDEEVDPAPVPEGAFPLRLTPGNPDWAAANRALWGVTSKARLKAMNPGAKYFNAVLDRLGIETSVANRISMPADLDPHGSSGSFTSIRCCFRSTTAVSRHATRIRRRSCRTRRSCSSVSVSRRG